MDFANTFSGAHLLFVESEWGPGEGFALQGF